MSASLKESYEEKRNQFVNTYLNTGADNAGAGGQSGKDAGTGTSGTGSTSTSSAGAAASFEEKRKQWREKYGLDREKSTAQQDNPTWEEEAKYITSWLQDANSYVSDLQYLKDGISYSMAKNQEGNSKRYAAGKDLADRADIVVEYLNKNRDLIGEEQFRELIDSVQFFRSERVNSAGLLHSAQRFYSNWDTEDAYNQFLSQEENDEYKRLSELWMDQTDRLEEKRGAFETKKAADGLSQEERDQNIQSLQDKIKAIDAQIARNARGSAYLGQSVRPEQDKALLMERAALSEELALVMEGGEHREVDVLTQRRQHAMKTALGLQEQLYQGYAASPYAGNNPTDVDDYRDSMERLGRLEDRADQLDYFKKYDGKTYKDDFWGQSRANFTMGRLSQDSSMAWYDYLQNPTQENREKAETVDQLMTQFQRDNGETLADDGKLPWLSKTLANYLPQFFDQMVYEAAGAAITAPIGAVFGNGNITKAGAVAGSGLYSYRNMQGAAFKSLLEAGIDEETARAASKDEAVVSSLIEMADTILDLALLGGGNVIDLFSKGAATGMKTAVTQLIKKYTGKNLLTKAAAALGKYGIDVVGEGLEEGTQEAVSIANAQRDGTGAWDLAKNAGKIFWDAMTGKNQDDREQILEAGKEGIKIAAMMGGIESATNTLTAKTMENYLYKKAYGDSAQEIVAEALEVDPNNTLAQALKGKLEQGKSPSGLDLHKIVEQTESTLFKQDKQAIRSAVENRLTALGETADVSVVAEALTKQAAGESLTKRERKILADSRYAKRVANEMNPELMQAGDYTSDWASDIKTERIHPEAYGGATIQSETKRLGFGKEDADFLEGHLQESADATDEMLANGIREAYQYGQKGIPFAQIPDTGFAVMLDEASRRISYNNGRKRYLDGNVEEVSARQGSHLNGADSSASDAIHEASEDGKTYVNSTGEPVEIREVAGIQDGELILRLQDGRVVSSGDITYANRDEALIYGTVAEMGASVQSANILINSFKNAQKSGSSITASEYAHGILDAFRYGKLGIPQQELANSTFASKLTAAQQDYVYRQGRKAAGKQTAKEQASVSRKPSVQGNEKTVDASKEGKQGQVHFDRKGRTFDDVRETSLKTMEQLAAALGVDFYVFESYVKDGKRVYRDADGNEVTAHNGWYDPDYGSIHIDLNAGMDGKGIMLFTVAHELTHFIRQWSPAKFKVLSNFLMAEYGRKGVSVNDLVQEQIAKAKRNGRDITFGEAHEEVVADSMETMLSDGKAEQKLAKLNQLDKTLREKMKDFISDLAQKIRKAYENLKPDSAEGRIVAEMKDSIEKLQELFAEALVDASENYRAAEVKENTDREGGERYQTRPSERDTSPYSYENLTAKPDMVVTAVGGNVPNNRADVVHQAKRNAAKVGKFNTKDGSVSVHVKDIGKDVVLGTAGLKHSLDRRFDANAPVTLKAGEILSNSIQINELTPQKTDADESYVLIGAAKGENGELYVVRSVVNKFSSELSSMDVLYAINAKKGNRLRSMRPGFQGPVTDSTISISELLDYVNDYFPDILPEGVLKHYGYDARPEGKLGESALYSDRDPEMAKVNRALEKENAKLREDVVSLKELLKLQRQVTGGTKFTQSSVEAAAGLLMKSANAKGNKAEFAKILNGFYEYIAKGDDLTWEGVSEQAQRAVQWLQEHENIKKEIDGYAQDILREIRENRFYLDENQKKEAAYQYGSYNEWRKKTIGSTTVANDAKTSLDSLWGALSEKYPNIFDPNTTSTDMPAALLDAIDTLRNMKPMDDYAYDSELAAQDMTRQVYESYWNVSTLHTVADVKQRQIDRLRGEHLDRMEKVKTTHKEQVAKLKQEHKAELERVRKAYRENAEKKQQEIIDKYQKAREKNVEGRKRTAMRHKIQSVVKELNQYLLNGTKERHVPIELQKAVAEALDAVNMDTVGAEERIAKLEERLLNAKTAKEAQEISRTVDRIRSMGDSMNTRLRALKDGYEEIIHSDDPLIANSYDPGIAAQMMTLMVEVGDTPLRDMSLKQLEAVHDVYTMVLATIRNANKTFTAERNATVRELGQKVVDEVKTVGGKRQYSTGFAEAIRKFGWNNLKPVYAFEFIGSDTFSQIFKNVRAGEDAWVTDVNEARNFYLETAKKYGYNTWDNGKQYDFTSTSGMKFSLNLEQIMSLYAYSKREQAADHIRKGGIVIDESTEVTMKTKLGIPVKFNPTEATAYNISDETLSEIIGKLTPEQKAYVDEMQTYLSSTMGEKGNEVSLKLYGIKLFKEKNYFPLKSASQYMAKAKEQQEGNVRIKNSGFSKETVKGASNPIVLTPFMQVWADHVNDMSMYHAFVLPMEDFYRVYNFKTGYSDISDAQSVNAAIQNAYGKGATAYIDQLMKDLNGGARVDSTTGIINKSMNLFKKGAVFASASVVIQQPSAIARALSMVDMKYFAGQKVDKARHKILWEEVKQYAPVAAIKEMGYFDTNMGKSTRDYILGQEYEGIVEKAKALFTDSGFRDEVLSKAPALADEITWCAIWEAVKRETKAKHDGLDVRSEQFLKLAGERFTDVIVKTQVYDSVLSRSANMRSKDTGMKMATAFMAEPTTSINMVADALLKGKRGGVEGRRYCRRAIGSVVAATILNAVLVSFVRAARDDDDDETYLEKYLGAFTAEVIDGLNPATYIPFAKDIVSIVQGYDVERSDVSVISDLWKAWEMLQSDDISSWRKVEEFAGSICQLFGLPLKNIMRDSRAMYQVIETFTNGEKATLAGLRYAAQEALTGKNVSDKEQLYQAYISGDASHLERVRNRYEDEDSYNAAMRSAIREHFIGNDIDEATAQKYLVLYGGKDGGEAHWTVDEWKYGKENGSADGYGKYEKLYAAVQTGNDLESVIKEYTDNGVKESTLSGQITEHFKPAYLDMEPAGRADIKDRLVDALELCGVDSEKAEERLSGWDFEADYGFAYADRKEAYLNEEISANQLRSILVKTGGYSAEDADSQIEVYDWEKEGISGATAAAIRSYNEYCAAAGVSRKVFMEIRQFSNNTENDVDENGEKIAYSAVKKIMAKIDGFSISDEQKTALARSMGWKEKTIQKYKLW